MIEYVRCVWDIGNFDNKHRLERLQRKWVEDSDGWSEVYYMSYLTKKGLYSFKGCLMRIYLIQKWKAFHNDINVGLSDTFGHARNINTRGHIHMLFVPLCRKYVKRRSFTMQSVTVWK